MNSSKRMLLQRTGVVLLLLVIGGAGPAGCGPMNNPPDSTASGAVPVAGPAITAWAHGDTAAAVQSFVQADWNARPLFPSDSPLSLSEARFVKLPSAQREASHQEILLQLDALKKLAGAVAESGRNAAAAGNTAKARDHFTALKRSGEALAGPDCLAVVQLVGKAFQRMADAELAKVPY